MTVLTVSSLFFLLVFFFFPLSVLSSLSLFCSYLLSLYSSLLFFFLFSCFPSFLPLFFIFFLSFSFLFSSLLFPFFSGPLPSLFFFYSLFPYFYRKNRGERGRGNHYAAGPKTARGAHSLLFSPPLDRPQVRGYTSGVMVGVFFMLFGERGREKLVKKSHSSPASHVQRKKKTYSAVQNDTIWVFFLREQCMKRRCFGQNAPFHLKGKGGKKVSEFTLVLNL